MQFDKSTPGAMRIWFEQQIAKISEAGKDTNPWLALTGDERMRHVWELTADWSPQAIETLIGRGCMHGLVNAGGDLRVFGPRAEPMFLRRRAGELTNIEIADAALAVSDANSRQRPPEHQGYYGTASLAVDYAAVIANEAVIADALAKCVLLCPKPVAEHALRTFDATQAFTGQ